MHRSGKAANEPAVEVVQVVGYIKVDLDTPTPVLREFIRRFCGGWLNEHAKVKLRGTTSTLSRETKVHDSLLRRVMCDLSMVWHWGLYECVSYFKYA